MKKLITGTILVAAALALLRRFGPGLAQACMSKCGEMVDHMPEHSPPKRMMRKLEEARGSKRAMAAS